MSFFESLKNSISAVGSGVVGFFSDPGHAYTTAARWIFIVLAVYILVKSILSLLRNTNPPKVWAYFNVNGDHSEPVTHWENVIGRSQSCDIVLDDPAVSRSHGTLSRNDDGSWRYLDLGSSNGTVIGGVKYGAGEGTEVEPGDEIIIGRSVCTIFPTSLEERRNNLKMRRSETFLTSPYGTLAALTVLQMMAMLQLYVALGDDFNLGIAASFIGIAAVGWIYVLVMRARKLKGFECETIALFLSTLSLSVTASKYPQSVFKQFAAVVIGVILFAAMCAFLRDLDRSKAVRKYLCGAAVALLLINLAFGKLKYGAANWIEIGGISIQPSEIVKLAFIWTGAASLDELMERRNSLIYMAFAGFCFACLAIMGDFGTALIFFVSFVVTSFLRSGDFTKMFLIIGVAAVGGILVIRFRSYVADRFEAWGHVWEYADTSGYQQTRTMSAIASGGLVGVGAGEGWLKNVGASESDLVFGFVTEEWGLIIAILAVVCIVTLSVFAVRSIMAGRSAFYTIAACSAMSLFLFQTMLNVFGSIDILPLTGVTFPFVSMGGTSMVSSWGMLAFLKAADMRLGAGIDNSIDSDVGDEGDEESEEENELTAEDGLSAEGAPGGGDRYGQRSAAADEDVESFDDLRDI